MNDFLYSIPAEVIFGELKEKTLIKYLNKYNASKVLLIYGKNSIKKNGLYELITSALKSSEIDFYELAGVNPNPDITDVARGCELVTSHKIDLLLAVGGGSTIDCAKAIACSAGSNTDPWETLMSRPRLKTAIPIGVVLTTAATGSEMNANYVISNRKTQEKVAFNQPVLKPSFVFADPKYTFGISKYQTASGASDILAHLLEQYFDSHDDDGVTDRMIEGVMQSVLHYTPVALNEPTNYEARSNLMWASSLALSTLFFCGKKTGGDWGSHTIEHQISAIYDIAHGAGLAIVFPNTLKYFLQKDIQENLSLIKFHNLAVNVFHLNPADFKNEESLANECINLFTEFFKSINMPTTLREVNITDEHFGEMARKSQLYKSIGKYHLLDADAVLKILNMSL